MAGVIASASPTATIPQLCCYYPGGGSRKVEGVCSPSRSILMIPNPRSYATCSPLTRFDNSRHPRPSLSSRRRWSSDGAFLGSASRRKKDNAWKRSTSTVDGTWNEATFSERRKHICCLRCCSKSQSSIKVFSSRVFADKSTFHMSRQTLDKILVKRVHVPNAAVGPDEPQAASTAWADGILEKQSLEPLDPEIGRTELERFLGSELPSHPKLYRGQLRNGLRYLILPNKVPPNRFEAHMELHVGSIDEEDDEQGIAHMIEHVAFLGSKKREKLLGTGARSNAYTDFHHTVFHIHSPTHTKDSDGDLLPSVLDALNEIAFQPKFLASRVEKERKAILSELQMMNTIEYRVDCQLLQHLHSENKLSKRFPIGLEEQIKMWDADKIRKFHERWYFPANATLYIVGDVVDIPKTIQQIEAVFGQTGTKDATVAASTPTAFGAMASFLVPKLGLAGSFSPGGPASSVEQSNFMKKERHAVRPPVKHNWSISGNNENAKPPQIFQHELLQNFSINMFCKIPVDKVRTYGDLRNVLMKRIFLSALHFRINTRYKSSNPPFTSIELDHSDSGREGCTVTTLTVNAEPMNWQSAIKVAVQEVRRLKEFGVTKGELARYMDALLKDSEHLAAMIDNVSSVDNLDFIMESDALGHTVMDQRQGHESLVNVAAAVTLEEVNSVGAKVLEFISDFGKPSAPLPAAIVACVPKKVHVDEMGETDFIITPDEITNAVRAGLEEPIEPEPELEIPKELISSSRLQELHLQLEPSFIQVSPEEVNVTENHDKETGITQRRLSNGIAVNYKVSRNEARGGVMRLIVGGGRAAEMADARGAVVLGVRTLSEGGRVGNYSREQVELFCVNHLINCSLESTEELICMEFRFTLRDNGMRAAFQLLHMVLEHSVWLDDAFDRARQLYLSYYRSIPKSLERSTAHKLMLAMLNGDERFVEPTPQSLENLTLESVRDAVMNQFYGENMEVSIVGDFSEEEIESCILDYLGTVRATRNLEKGSKFSPVIFRQFPSDLLFQQVYLKDTDERACAYIAGPAPNRWGFTADGEDLFDSIKDTSAEDDGQLKSGDSLMERKDAQNSLQGSSRSHPLFFAITLGLLAEIINSRLFTTVRDSLGLTYDVSFELSLFDRLKLGWYVISVTSTPAKVYKAVDACKNVLRGLHSNQVVPRELDRAKRTLLMRHEAEIKSNAYWLGLMAHLQAASVPRKDISCIKDLTSLYEAATIADIYLAYEQLKIDDSSLYSCIGIAGSQAGEEVQDSLEEEEESIERLHDVIPLGRGTSTMTRPTT